MLRKLHIQNYAIIDDVTVSFTNGLTIITGETGAGKSIILGALGLIMGKRADSKVLYLPENKCIVEAVFSSPNEEIQLILTEEELDAGDELIIRRELSPAGKSRAFVNDTPVTLDILQKLSLHLLDLHQQWDNLDIHEENYQMEMLDAFTKHKALRESYKTHFLSWKNEQKHLTFLENQQQKSARETEFNTFLLDELEMIQPIPGEQGDLEKELDLLSNAQTIQEIFARIHHVMEVSDASVIETTASVMHDLSGIRDLDAEYGTIYERIFSILEELKDISRESEKISELTEYNPDRIQIIRERLNTLYKIQKKHGVNDEAGLLEVWENLKLKSEDIGQLEVQIEHTRKNITRLEKVMQEEADTLHEARVKTIPVFEQSVKELLVLLKMDHARLEIRLIPAESFNEHGKESIQWLFAANKGSQVQPIKSVASGGEISRLNLCIKSILANTMTLPTLIFDEIDAGVSGDVAQKMGELLAKLSRHHQIISITHSPQVASKATRHLFVYKDHEGEKTLTRIKDLSGEEKIHEIAIMLSSDPPTSTAIEAAKELLAGE